jgi:4-amino-4-deoxy-L-arabinose transferase-like glycosyltransferase
VITIKRSKILPWIILGIILAFVIAVRVRLLDVPLERDEGEYAYMGQLMLQGVPPYAEAYNMKLPGTAMMYALFMALFGQTTSGIHAGLMAVNAASIVLVFLVGRKLMSTAGALSSSAAYSVLSLGSSVLGFAAHATHLVVLPALGGSLLLLNAVKKRATAAFFLPGMLFGLAFIMKQPGLFFLLFGMAFMLFSHVSSETKPPAKDLLLSLSAFSSGGALPLLAVVLWTVTSGSFEKFWFWTVQYAFSYGSQVSGDAAWFNAASGLSGASEGVLPLWLLALSGFAAMFFFKDMSGQKRFFTLFLFFSTLTVLPGFYFRAHYFITLLPALSLSVGLFVDIVNRMGSRFQPHPVVRWAGSGAFIALLASLIASQSGYLFSEDPVSLSRRFYEGNPFAESMEIARFIEADSSPADKIAVFGSEPQIYFYAKRRAATGYLYTYGLMEYHPYAREMQQEMIREIEQSRPKYIVAVHDDLSWLIRPGSERLIFEWFESYVQRGYKAVGIVDMISRDGSLFISGPDAEHYSVRASAYLIVYKRV